MGQQAPGIQQRPPADIPMQIDGLNVPSPSMQTGGLNVMPPQGNGMVYDPYGGNYNSNPLAPPPMRGDPVGPQNFGRNLDVSAYLPGGAQYKSWR
jgi:hypothetical protein